MIMPGALEQHSRKVGIGGRNIVELRFADDIDALAEEEQEKEALVESLNKICTRYRSEISAKKQTHYKQRKRQTDGAKGKRAEAGLRNDHQIPRSNCLR